MTFQCVLISAKSFFTVYFAILSHLFFYITFTGILSNSNLHPYPIRVVIEILLNLYIVLRKLTFFNINVLIQEHECFSFCSARALCSEIRCYYFLHLSAVLFLSNLSLSNLYVFLLL